MIGVGLCRMVLTLVPVMAIACASARRAPPSQENVRGEVAYDGRGSSSIYIRNQSSTPIVINSLVVTLCHNVASPCDSTTNPDVRIDPGKRRVVARVLSKSLSRPNFRYFYRWQPVGGMVATTMPGKESGRLLARFAGTVVLAQPLARLEIVTLPDKQRRFVERERWHPQYMDGPDASGVIALATDSVGWTEHALRLRYPDDREEVLVRRPGGLLWHQAIGPIALAPVGGRIAFARKTGASVNDYQPLGIGTLEMWDPASRSVRSLDAPALALKPSWFPDGRRLVFVHAPVNGIARIVMMDVTTGEREPIAPGNFAIVSSDGRTILVRHQGLPTVIDVATRASKNVALPGVLDAPFAFIDSRYVVYRALPTEGRSPGVTTNNSPLVGPKAMQTIKLVDLENGEFVTLVDSVDPRMAISASLRRIND